MGWHGVLDDAFNHLISRSPQQFWTSGQWMTERKGGSDVGAYELCMLGDGVVMCARYVPLVLHLCCLCFC